VDSALELAALIERDPRNARRLIESFVEGRTFPLVDEHDTATFFFWDGQAIEAVYLQHWVFGLASRVEFRRIPGTDAFYLPLDLPKNARVEYKFEVVRKGHGRWMQDPRNPRRAYDPFGSNSVCQAASYQEPHWVWPDAQSRQGRLVEGSLHSEALGDERRYQMYVPAEARPGKRYPLLIVHDGADFLHFAWMKNVLDNLIHRHEVAPLLVCFTSGVYRNSEYAANPSHARFLADELRPHLLSRFPALHEPQFNGLMGASFGGVAALHAAATRPGTWGRLLLQSGSFAFTDIGEHTRGPQWDPIVQFVNGFRERPPTLGAQVYLSCGTFESLIYYNRSLVPLFQQCAEGVLFREVPDGHNWINWRDRLQEGLMYLFPGPLWMYYE